MFFVRSLCPFKAMAISTPYPTWQKENLQFLLSINKKNHGRTFLCWSGEGKWQSETLSIPTLTDEKSNEIGMCAYNRVTWVSWSSSLMMMTVVKGKSSMHRNRNTCEAVHINCIATSESFRLVAFAFMIIVHKSKGVEVFNCLNIFSLAGKFSSNIRLTALETCLDVIISRKKRKSYFLILPHNSMQTVAAWDVRIWWQKKRTFYWSSSPYDYIKSNNGSRTTSPFLQKHQRWECRLNLVYNNHLWTSSLLFSLNDRQCKEGSISIPYRQMEKVCLSLSSTIFEGASVLTTFI
jgi:hypothetical protein